MQFSELPLDKRILDILGKGDLRPCQEKALKKGVLEGKSVLVCSPTASGKTLVGEMAILQALSKGKKAVYVVPLIALANEKFKQFKTQWGSLCSIALSVGDLDSSSTDLGRHDVIVCTAEKLDSLVRHQAKWLPDVGCLVVDEIHLLNDPGRGPVLEVLITVLKRLLPKLQIVGLSATIGNPEELAAWLKAELVRDDWRPVPLHQGVYVKGKIEFQE
ncbi:hypothetical protein CMO91_06600 [Candidatus Woesearchaeota archaeon]|jgi:helicase|nr:hypothetical protein [Candidatus Woesearchaeota archaeon]